MIAFNDFASGVPDVVCFSHLRWDLVFQRPQHLLTRFGERGRVFYVEEPVWDDGPTRLHVERRGGGLHLVVPHLRWQDLPHGPDAAVRGMVDELFRDHDIDRCVLWYYTPMALAYSDHLAGLAVVYDCMDELSAFRGAPPAMLEREAELLRRADLVFTGGPSLYEAKRGRHPSVHLFPSSIDAAHFGQAREGVPEPADQAPIPLPRIGFYGVLDERLDVELLRDAAALRPDWHWVMIGPVVKISHDELPQANNIHYLGARGYGQLPRYLAGWDVAVVPFARNESTRFISPTKTPEYLAAGRRVVSTPIRDVVRPYAEGGLLAVAEGAADFVAAIEAALAAGNDDAQWLARVDGFLAGMSWDCTWAAMAELVDRIAAARRGALEGAMDGVVVAEMDDGRRAVERGAMAAD